MWRATDKPLLVGQAPSRAGGGEGPLRGRCGEFLAGLVGLTCDELHGRVDAVNLLSRWPGKAGKGDAFPMGEARRAARRLDAAGRAVVLLGRLVAKACGLGQMSFLERKIEGTFLVLLLPHPSGIVRWWNDAANRRAASRDLAEVLEAGGCRTCRRRRACRR